MGELEVDFSDKYMSVSRFFGMILVEIDNKLMVI